jgi:ATP-dependent DNA ligase
LYLNGAPLLKHPYATRRQRLEEVVHAIPGFVSSI